MATSVGAVRDVTKANLKDAVHQKKVLTEDDLHPQPKHNDDSSDDRDFNRVCNPLCEQLVRDQVQTDRDSELEFRNQFALATHEIGNDLKWGAAFADARNAAEDYCDLERTKAKYAYPRSTAPYTSDKMPYDFIVKERDAYYKFKEMEDRVKVRFLAVRQTDTFRSTVMQTSWDVALARTCRDVEHL